MIMASQVGNLAIAAREETHRLATDGGFAGEQPPVPPEHRVSFSRFVERLLNERGMTLAGLSEASGIKEDRLTAVLMLERPMTRQESALLSGKLGFTFPFMGKMQQGLNGLTITL
jgi:hypothetical protein